MCCVGALCVWLWSLQKLQINTHHPFFKTISLTCRLHFFKIINCKNIKILLIFISPFRSFLGHLIIFSIVVLFELV